jgi:hypothetical protein
MQGKARETDRNAEQPGVHLVAIAAGLALKLALALAGQ